MDMDHVCMDMFEAQDGVGLVMLAHYAALMSMRTNYWYFQRWPRLLLESIAELLAPEWHQHISWPRNMIELNTS